MQNWDLLYNVIKACLLIPHSLFFALLVAEGRKNTELHLNYYTCDYNTWNQLEYRFVLKGQSSWLIQKPNLAEGISFFRNFVCIYSTEKL